MRSLLKDYLESGEGFMTDINPGEEIWHHFVCQADENLRLIRSSLPEAVEACIDAAGHEFDVSRQRTLLRAASYGQAFSRLVRILFQYFKCSDEKSE